MRAEDRTTEEMNNVLDVQSNVICSKNTSAQWPVALILQLCVTAGY
jgi:hypothetical protein